LGIAATGARWLGSLAFGWLLRRSPRALLDNAPLARLLAQHVDFPRIEETIASRAVHAVSITCSGFTSGESVTFFQGRHDIEPWRRHQRIGSHVRLTLDHLMASSAIPFVFPAVRINREYFGDGSMRQLAPISPAIHLGADRILVIGVGRMADEVSRHRGERYPSLAQIGGHALSSIFLDALAADIEQVQRINHTVNMIPEAVRRERALALRPIDLLVISPSRRLDRIAAGRSRSLPWPVRALLGGLGGARHEGGALVSYLLFEASYTGALIELGYGDTMARRDEVVGFLFPEPA